MVKRERELLKLIKPMGWHIIKVAGNNHYLLGNSKGNTYHASFSSSDYRHMRNLESSLRKVEDGVYNEKGAGSGVK